jgi:hypothetical protein
MIIFGLIYPVSPVSVLCGFSQFLSALDSGYCTPMPTDCGTFFSFFTKLHPSLSYSCLSFGLQLGCNFPGEVFTADIHPSTMA